MLSAENSIWEMPMSTDFAPLTKIAAVDLFDGRLAKFGVREHIVQNETTKSRRCLTDGRNYVWVYMDDEDLVACFTRYMSNGAPGKILNAIAEAFDSDIVSEYEPQFWGFDTQEEWDAVQEELAQEGREQSYVSILRYLRGEPNDIRPGTIGMTMAEIAKKLVEENPELLQARNKEKLLSGIDTIYHREYTVSVTLSEADRAAALMFVTHEDDLPSA
jgi:hypothetical protein